MEIPFDSDRTSVIVEPRKHEHLELVIKNIVYYTPGWSLYIFHSKENEDFVKELIGPDKSHQIHLICLCRINMSFSEFNTLLMMDFFWNWIEAENILIFHCDSYLRRFGIDQFLEEEYAFIGAPWSHDNSQTQGGNGGLSLRKKSKMLEAINTGRKYTLGFHEDGYFQDKLKAIGAKLPDRKRSEQFSVETIYYPDPLGVHRYWDHLEDKLGTLSVLEIK